MAITTTPLPNDLAFNMTKESIANLTLSENLRSGPARIYGFDIDNTVAASSANWLKVFNSDGKGLTVGTTTVDLLWPVKASSVVDLHVPGGLYFNVGVSLFASKEGGKTATAAPDQNMAVHLITKE